MTTMTSTQRFLIAILPRSWANDMRAESLQWRAECPCSYKRSMWEIGGIRWKAKGNPKRRIACPQCGTRTWHTIRFESTTPSTENVE